MERKRGILKEKSVTEKENRIGDPNRNFHEQIDGTEVNMRTCLTAVSKEKRN